MQPMSALRVPEIHVSPGAVQATWHIPIRESGVRFKQVLHHHPLWGNHFLQRPRRCRSLDPAAVSRDKRGSLLEHVDPWVKQTDADQHVRHGRALDHPLGTGDIGEIEVIAQRSRISPFSRMMERYEMMKAMAGLQNSEEKLALVRELAQERNVRQQQTVMVATLMLRIRNLQSEVSKLQQRAQRATDSEADSVGGTVDAS